MSPGGDSMRDKESCSHQETLSFPPTSPRGSNPTQTPSPAALQLLPWLYPTAVEEFLCSAAISPHIPFPSPLLHPNPSQLHTGPGQESRRIPRTPNPRHERPVNALCRLQAKRTAFPFLIH